MDCSSIPAAPRFALTLNQASHTACLGMSNGFTLDLAPGSSRRSG